MRAARRFIRSGLPLLALASAAAGACKGDPPTPPGGPAFAGSFRLETIGGHALPYDYYCFGSSCETVLSGRVEVMSLGRVRDILVFRLGPTAAPITDTTVSAYTSSGQRVILARSPSGGSMSTYADTGEMDGSGRFLLKPRLIQVRGNSLTFLYARE